MCMALVAETSVVMYVYGLGDSGPGHDGDELGIKLIGFLFNSLRPIRMGNWQE